MTSTPSHLRSSPVLDAPGRTVGVRWFLLLTFAGSWIPWAVVWAAGYSLDDPVIQLLTAAFVPALAAIVTRRWITGEGLSDAGLALRFRQAWSSYAIATLMPVGVLVLALVMAALSGMWDIAAAPVDRQDGVFLAVALLIPVLVAPVFWGEEFGWTAYLRDRLMPGRPVATTFATGVIWGVWHWPLPWVGYFGADHSAGEAILAMLMWLPLSVLLEFVIGWLWGRSGSVWPPAILHGGSNLVVAVGIDRFIAPDAHSGATTLLMCLAYLPVVGAILVSTLPGRRGATAVRS